jgi:hypothetical protein
MEVTLAQHGPQQGELYDRLLGEMPRIAEVANQFTSEENQRAAFEALVRAIGMPAPPLSTAEPNLSVVPPLPEDTAITPGFSQDNAGQRPPAVRPRRTRRSAPANVSAERDIDFRPEGKQSFKDFVIEKKPKSNDERNVVAVYYLERILEVPSITVGHVLAAYKEREWREPSDPANSLQVTASAKNWLNTANMAAVRTTPGGRNVVEHDMPLASKQATSA